MSIFHEETIIFFYLLKEHNNGAKSISIFMIIILFPSNLFMYYINFY